jgi:hypothetical protein
MKLTCSMQRSSESAYTPLPRLVSPPGDKAHRLSPRSSPACDLQRLAATCSDLISSRSRTRFLVYMVLEHVFCATPFCYTGASVVGARQALSVWLLGQSYKEHLRCSGVLTINLPLVLTLVSFLHTTVISEIAHAHGPHVLCSSINEYMFTIP